jgi:hypothetical protein
MTQMDGGASCWFRGGRMANRLPSITITGADGLIELLKSMPEKQILPAVNKGMRAVGMKTIRKARTHLKTGSGVETGQYRKSLGIRALKTYKRECRVVMYLGPRRGFAISKRRRKHDPFHIGHLLEYGHRIAGSGAAPKGASDYGMTTVFRRGKERSAISTNRTAGYVRPIPHLRPAVDSSKSDFNKQMIEKIGDVLRKAKAKADKAALPTMEWPVGYGK